MESLAIATAVQEKLVKEKCVNLPAFVEQLVAKQSKNSLDKTTPAVKRKTFDEPAVHSSTSDSEPTSGSETDDEDDGEPKRRKTLPPIPEDKEISELADKVNSVSLK